MKTSSESLADLFQNMAEIWTDFYHDIQTITDDYADKKGLPTQTIDEYNEIF